LWGEGGSGDETTRSLQTIPSLASIYPIAQNNSAPIHGQHSAISPPPCSPYHVTPTLPPITSPPRPSIISLCARDCGRVGCAGGGGGGCCATLCLGPEKAQKSRHCYPEAQYYTAEKAYTSRPPHAFTGVAWRVVCPTASVKISQLENPR
jgi:hypothetical protein